MDGRMRVATLVVVVVLAVLVGYGDGSEVQPDGSAAVPAANVELVSGEASAAPAEVGTDELQALVQGNTAFAVDLFRRLSSPGENLVTSPFSVSRALAMTYAGAEGQTAEELRAALCFGLPDERLHEAMAALADGLSERHPDLVLADQLWGQPGDEPLASYLDLLASQYDAGLRLVDFADDEGARRAINDWVAQQTAERIPELLPPGSLNNSFTALVITGALHVSGRWASPFDPQNTRPDYFFPAGGEAVEVPMMQEAAEYGYAEGAGWRAVELPCDGEQLSLVILLPEEGHFEEFVTDLSAERFEGMLDGLEPAFLTLTMPKFEIDTRAALGPVLQDMGLMRLFSEADADLSGIFGSTGYSVDDVHHGGSLSVDERGFEAAAGTAVVVEKGIGESVRLDRPFVWAVRDLPTGTLLFLGQVVDPSAGTGEQGGHESTADTLPFEPPTEMPGRLRSTIGCGRSTSGRTRGRQSGRRRVRVAEPGVRIHGHGCRPGPRRVLAGRRPIV